MRTADNQTGYNIELLGPAGWQAITATPFADRPLADQHLAGMERAPGAEYRIYPALAPR